MKAVILAGGLGSRMGDMCRDVPKPMVEICQKPILLHQIETLKKEGITEFIFITGYLFEKIEKYFGDGKTFGVNISYFREQAPLGTAGALFCLDLKDDFLLCNGDLIFDIALDSMISFHKSKNALATLLSHPSTHPEDSLSLFADENDCIRKLYPKNEKPNFYPNLCNSGIQIVSPKLLKMYSFEGKADFDRDVIAPAVGTGKIFAYRSAEYVRDAGTPERLKQVEKDITSDIVKKHNKHNLQRAVFLDRDGTLNKHKGYITNPDDVELLPGTIEAIQTFHDLGYLAIVITNQPVIARGDCTKETLIEINNRLEMLLSEKGTYLDAIYYCPHHPDKGFEGEVEELKIKCSCRKPEPGLILKAKEVFNIDLLESFMVGDSTIDIKAGENAGCKSVLISDDKKNGVFTFNSVYDFAMNFLNGQI